MFVTRKSILLLTLFFLLAFPRLADAQQLYAYRDSVREGYDFLLYLPPGADTVPSPLPTVLFLHGKSLCGTDLNQVMRYGTIDALKRGLQLNAVVIAPQTDVVGWQAERLDRIVSYVNRKFPCDTNRFYVIGMSMGGWGTLKMVHSYPEKVAAAVAMCGGYEASSLSGLPEVPLWIIHGFRDTVTAVSYSASLVKRLYDSGLGTRLIYDQPACGHAELARMFYLPELYDWLFSHNLQDIGRPVNLGYTYTEEKMNAAYSRLDPEKAINLVPQLPPYVPDRLSGPEPEPEPEIHSWEDMPSLFDWEHPVFVRLREQWKRNAVRER
ncbi:MAG: phospholipase [Bacteroidales bacterium]|nr:phospholipase [Bacteroidales bacterium]